MNKEFCRVMCGLSFLHGFGVAGGVFESMWFFLLCLPLGVLLVFYYADKMKNWRKDD